MGDQQQNDYCQECHRIMKAIIEKGGLIDSEFCCSFCKSKNILKSKYSEEMHRYST